LNALDPVEYDATGQAELVRKGAVSARGLVEATLRRIGQLDGTLNAFRVVLADEALAEADRIDTRERERSEVLPLLGVPIAIKDDTDVAGQVTAWGSSADRPAASADAEVVTRLRAAGAIVIGKTQVPELTLWPWTASKRWGITRNPWDPGRTPGGSSGGSAAAVASGMCAMALGSDGGGSVRYPAGLTGLIGVKPQRARIPVGPEHASAWHGLLALGPLTRSVRDAALFLDLVSDDAPAGGYRARLRPPFTRLRIGVSTEPPPGTQVSLGASAREAVESTTALVEDLGHEIVNINININYGLASLWNSTVRLLKGVEHDVSTVPELAQLERRTRRVARIGKLLPDRSLRRALAREPEVAAAINAVFGSVDVLLTPLCARPAPKVDDCPSTGALRSFRSSNTSAWLVPWNVTGQPAVAVPAGIDDEGLPTAVQLVGRPNDESMLLQLATEIESNRPFPRWSPRPPPAP
jgi:amidase